jgi:hypothetical protein
MTRQAWTSLLVKVGHNKSFKNIYYIKATKVLKINIKGIRGQIQELIIFLFCNAGIVIDYRRIGSGRCFFVSVSSSFYHPCSYRYPCFSYRIPVYLAMSILNF